MGWWKTEGGDIIGDGPADIVSEHLEELSQRLLTQRARRLTLGQLLAHLHVVLTMKARDLLAPGDDGPVESLTADVATDGQLVHVDGVASIVEEIRDGVDTMSESISRTYMEELERRPSTSELLAAIRFVLGSQPDRYLDIAEGASVRRIYARPREVEPGHSP